MPEPYTRPRAEKHHIKGAGGVKQLEGPGLTYTPTHKRNAASTRGGRDCRYRQTPRQSHRGLYQGLYRSPIGACYRSPIGAVYRSPIGAVKTAPSGLLSQSHHTPLSHHPLRNQRCCATKAKQLGLELLRFLVCMCRGGRVYIGSNYIAGPVRTRTQANTSRHGTKAKGQFCGKMRVRTRCAKGHSAWASSGTGQRGAGLTISQSRYSPGDRPRWDCDTAPMGLRYTDLSPSG
jgi:hypothetical protein